MGSLTNAFHKLRHASRDRQTGVTARKGYENLVRVEPLEERALVAVVSWRTADSSRTHASLGFIPLSSGGLAS